MIGAYATYVVQNLFRSAPAGRVRLVPRSRRCRSAFAASALVGMVLERSVIRFLYGRPLETLLATWGISLILIQAVRTIFGAQNVQVENPAWMSGGVELLPNLVLPYNRIVIIGFAAAVVAADRGCCSRARGSASSCAASRRTARWRPASACRPARVDTWAFGLGSGIAGLAGCALSQIGNVGPDLGQSYIVDSFMVVVLGGVGQLAGTVYAALGPRRRQQVPRGAGRARCSPRSRCWCSSSSSSRSGRRACSRSRAGARKHDAATPLRCRRPLPRPYARRRALRLRARRWSPRCVVARRARAGARTSSLPARQRVPPVRLLRHAGRQDHVLRDRRAGDGPDLGLHRHPLARPRPVLRARRLRDGHVPDAPDRPRRASTSSDLPDFMVFLDWKELPLVLELHRPLLVRGAARRAGARRCSRSCSASSPSARASRACTSRSSRRR